MPKPSRTFSAVLRESSAIDLHLRETLVRTTTIAEQMPSLKRKMMLSQAAQKRFQHESHQAAVDRVAK